MTFNSHQKGKNKQQTQTQANTRNGHARAHIKNNAMKNGAPNPQ